MPKKTAHVGIKFKRPKLGCSDRCGTCPKCEADKRARMPYYRAVYLSPASGKEVTVKVDSRELDKLVATPLPDGKADRVRLQERIDRALNEWGRRKRVELDKKQGEVDDGVTQPTGMTVAAARERFFEDRKQLRDATKRDYMTAIEAFERWAQKAKVTLDKLDVDGLRRFRAWTYEQPKRQQVAGGKRGAKGAREGSPRSVWTINGDLNGASMFLRFCARVKFLPRLSLDDIEYGLERFEPGALEIDYMRPAQLKQLLVAAEKHDAELFEMTRVEKARGLKRGTPKFTPITPAIIGAILSGMRKAELCLVTFKHHVDLFSTDFEDKEMGQINLGAHETKTKRARSVTFEVSPLLKKLIEVLQRKYNGRGTVFRITEGEAHEAMDRLRNDYGAPSNFTWQLLRKTCDTYLNCAPGIYGARAALFAAAQLDGSAFAEQMSSQRQGHSKQVARDFYIKIVRGIPKHATTLEAAMQIDDIVDAYIQKLDSQTSQARGSNVVNIR